MTGKPFPLPAMLFSSSMLLLAGCGELNETLALIKQDLTPLEITNTIEYYGEYVDDVLTTADTLVMFFSETGGGVTYEPSVYEYSSQGPTLGATIAKVTVQSNKTFYVTGARIEGLLTYLSEIGGSDPTGCGWVEYSYFNPADPAAGHDVLAPISLSLSFAPESNGGLNVVKVPADGQAIMEIGFGTKISYWMYADTDRDTEPFPTDNDEVIQLRGSLFLEGYLEDGTEFSGAFPPPLALEMEIEHIAY